MSKYVTTGLAVIGAVALVTRLPQIVNYALLHGTGTVVRNQKAWVPPTAEGE